MILNPMRSLLCAIALLFTAVLNGAAAEPVELGPNGGRLLPLNPQRSGYAEVTVEGDSFHVALLDAERKPVAIEQQALTVVGGERTKPARLPVETVNNRFVTPVPKGEEVWMLLQIKPSPGARKFRVRFHHDVKPCDVCRRQAWLCSCSAAKP